MRGRKPIPTATKKLRGNPGKRPLNKAEPQFARVLPRCPSHLSVEARREWRRVSAELYAQGLLTRVDRAALAGYCQAYGRWVRAEEALAQSSLVVKTVAGNIIPNPYLAIANRAMDDMRRFMVEFGMTPSSRSRITAAGPADEPTLEEQLFNMTVVVADDGDADTDG